MSTHTETRATDARDTALPAVRRRRHRRDWGRGIARGLCVVLALVGVLPFAATVVVRSAWARTWAAQQTEAILRSQGITARYTMSLRVWPLAVDLSDLRVDSSDGGAPALECTHARVRPKLFALLAGKIAIDQVELDEPRARIVVRDGKVVSLNLPQSDPGKKLGPIHIPFGTFALTDASIDLDLDGTRIAARALDLDVTSEDDPSAGSTIELSLRAGRTEVHRPRALPKGGMASDDDALCSVEARVRVEPGAVLVRRLQGVGSVDLDGAAGAAPPCDLPPEDKRRVELSLGHVRVAFPTAEGEMPAVDGHVRLRVPLALAERVAALPETDGWIGVDTDVRYARDMILPELDGSLEAHDVRLLQYSFAQELHSTFTLRRNVVQSPLTTVRFASGTVTLTDTVLDPLAQGAKLERTKFDAANIDFTALLRDLGVHKNSYVGWDIREVHVPVLSGTLVPLHIDGELTAKTYTFGVYDRPADDRSRQRLFGVTDAQIATHVAIRPDALRFQEVLVALPRSRVEGAFVSIGFHNDLRVEAPHITSDLDDVSPIGPVPMHGKVVASATVGGTFNHPTPEGDIQHITGFVVSDVAFGDLTAGHVKVDVAGPEVEITGVRAKRRDSAYEVPTAALRFGGSKGFAVDAVGSSSSFGLRDLLSMFALDDDPRYADLDARIATRADVRVVLGGPEDACGSGYIGVDAKSHLTGVAVYGEKFAQGDADVSMRWHDRAAGIAGADVDVRSFVLDKVEPPKGTRAGATGTVLGSASVRRGGALTANVMVEGVPLSRLDSLGSMAHPIEGSVSGMAHVTGELDDFRPDGGLVASAELDVSGTRVREVALAASHLDVRLTHRFTQQKRAVGHSHCGAAIAPPFDKAAFLADTTSHGDWTVNGDLLGGAVQLRDVVATRARAAHVSGRVEVRGLELGPLARLLADRKAESDEAIARPAAAELGGQLWGELVVDDLPVDDPGRARVRFFFGPTVVSRGGQKLSLQPPKEPATLAGDTLTLPPLAVTLDTPEGFQGGFVLTGNVTRLTHDPMLAMEARLEPVDLAILQRLVPRVEHAAGHVEGGIKVTGKATAPSVTGELHARADSIEVHGLPSAMTDVRLDVRASAKELSGTGTARFAGGTLSVDATVPVRGFDVGALDSHVLARGIRLAPANGIAATFDADLGVSYDTKGQGREGPALPRVSGDVSIESLSYTRPISLTTDLSTLGTRAKRTEVNAYDPSLDFVTLDVHVKSRSPFVIKNNLVEVQLAIDSGVLEVTGTNQRIGLRGALKTQAGGRFHFQSNEFDVRQGIIHFDDPTRIAPNVDVTAVTEYRRYTDTSAGAGAGASTTGGPSGASIGSSRAGSAWMITLHAYGDADDLRVEMTSEPSLSQEDIVLLLAVGMTRTELDQLQASSIGASIALNYLGAASGADRAVKQALPIIDDFRFGSAYSTVTGKTEPQLTVGKRLTNDLRANVTAGLSEDRELRSNIEWRLNNRLSVQGTYDNINDVSSSTLGNLGVDLRWRLEFE
jgi:translocation and assembly module TamB